MLSQTAEYALRAMVVLASSAGDPPRTAQEIAARAKVPLDYLAKVMLALGRAGLVLSQRGRGGGFVLARAAEAMSVLDVVNAVDPLRRIKSCPLDLEEHAAELCPLHRKLDEAVCSVERAFASTSIAEVAGGTRFHVQAATAR